MVEIKKENEITHSLFYVAILRLHLLYRSHFGFDAQGGVWYRPQTGFVDQFAGNAADAIGFVLDTHQGLFLR